MSEQHVLIPVVSAHSACVCWGAGVANVLVIYAFLHALLLCGSCVKGSTKRKRDWSLFRDQGWMSSLARSTHPSELSHFPFSQEALCPCGNPGIELLEDTSLKDNWGFFFFLQRSSPSGLPQQAELSFLVPDLHPTALLYSEHLKNRNCVLLTFVCTWHWRKCPTSVC